MKKYKHLWDKVITLDNFKTAVKNAIKGKRGYKEVWKIEKMGIDKYAQKMLDEVKNKTYKVSEYSVFHKFTGGKDREIYRLPMRDRVVQHAVMNVIEPIFRESFIKDTYAAIKGRGTHAAAKRVKGFLKNNYRYYLSLDIKKCYPSLDKEILKQKLAKKFEDKNIIWLLNLIIDSCEKGVPIGNYTSQYFNNFYFNDFDHWLKEVKGRKAYIRYCDNITILGKTKEELWELLEEIRNKMKELNVQLKEDYQVYDIEKKGVDVVGYIIHKDYTKVRKHTKNRFKRKVSKMNLDTLSKRDVNVLGAYWGIFVHGDCRNLWYKYTKVKSFKDLNIDVQKRFC